MKLALEIVVAAAGLHALRADWLDLLRRSEANEMMRSPLWLLPWWDVFGGFDGRELRVLVWRAEDGRLVGIAPMLRRRHTYRLALPFWRLEPLGSGEDPSDEVCSDYLGLVAERGAGGEIAESFADALVSGALGPADELMLPSMLGGIDDDGLSALASALRKRSWVVQVEPLCGSPYIALPRTWDEYLASLSQQKRYKIKRALRDFEAWSIGRELVRTVTRADELPGAFAALRALHGERWRAAGRSGAFASSRFDAFHQAVTRELLAHGALELTTLSVDDEPIAVVYNLIWNDKVYFYQSGRKHDLPKGVKPGIVLQALSIQRAIAEGRREYDFLAGTSRYKLDLALSQRQLSTLRAVRPSWREQARELTERGVVVARSLRSRWRARNDTLVPAGGDASTDEES